MSEAPAENIIVPHPLSWASVLTTMCFNEMRLADCTSFVYQKGNESFLVTNWHNLTGRHPDTKKPISEKGAVFPNCMELCFPLQTKPIKWHICRTEICKEDFSAPEWYEHPAHGSKVDVAVMPISFDTGFPSPPFATPVNTVACSEFTEQVGQDVFILGYPNAKTGGGALPLWKRGSIASEPQVQLDGLPKLLVDTATRKGMSGSPVIARNFGIEPAGQVNGEPIGWLGHQYKFLGVYSGRVFNDRPLSELFSGKLEAEAAAEAVLFAAQLGIVWKASVIDEIITGKKLPTC